MQDAVVNAVIDSLEKKDYLTMPMSTLYLFDRPQDYGFAHAEPVRVAMSRNHLRAWKSPYPWMAARCGASPPPTTSDSSAMSATTSVTHKIDPAIDGEREYVNDTLSRTGLVIQRTHVTPADPVTTASTATGGSFHSDGRILVLVLKDANTASKSN